jgi:hypothetical protein
MKYSADLKRAQLEEKECLYTSGKYDHGFVKETQSTT